MTDLRAFTNWLRPQHTGGGALPATNAELLGECHARRKLPDCEFLPADAAELSEALRALEVAGRIERRGTEWRWVSERKCDEALLF